MFTNATDKFSSLVMTGLADVDGFKIFIQVSMWLRFPPLYLEITINSIKLQTSKIWKLKVRDEFLLQIYLCDLMEFGYLLEHLNILTF